MLRRSSGVDEAASQAVPGRPLLARFFDLGAAAQASVPGLYAWGVTVVPVAWSRVAPIEAKAAAIVGPVCLAGAMVLERRAARASRYLVVWGLCAASAAVWLLARNALAPAKVDPLRAIAGVVGWGLFAAAAAAPTLKPLPSPNVVSQSPLRPRSFIPRGDVFFLGAGVILALALQLVGWRTSTPERLLLVRIAALGAGLSLIDAATTIALLRHVRRGARSARVRLRSATAWLLLLVLLAAAAPIALLPR